jgi:hypothetical protein
MHKAFGYESRFDRNGRPERRWSVGPVLIWGVVALVLGLAGEAGHPDFRFKIQARRSWRVLSYRRSLRVSRNRCCNNAFLIEGILVICYYQH